MTDWKGWKAVVRDVVIIWLLTAVGGFIVGIAAAGSGRSMVAIALANIILGTIGFCISGCMIKYDRWKHLIIVAVFVWLTSIINFIFGPFSLTNWFLGIIAILIMMAIGGSLSFLFVKSNSDKLLTERGDR